MKECTKCKESFPTNPEYFYTRKLKEEVKLSSWCKECQIKDSKENYKNNKEKWNKRSKKEYRKHKEKYNRINTDWNNRNKEQLQMEQRDWRRKNKDKVRGYNFKRASKNHVISKKEWLACKEYFNNSCAYCGLDEHSHKELYKQQLHKEHVIHDGRVDIKNCVPSCKPCNGSKHIRTLNEWYSKANPDYTRERYLRIYRWIRYDCK